ncbi:hypothetical protein [Microbacterium sp. AR7-10]|uniref:hypothetical protein n=1 Tax=Microbacterium sp. AR7-10 TaxID=1891970 RepID=UPI0008FCD83B|nr:hypothetical protein [Microbacterium sp. AR7-10]OIU88633.1 hypothetical protein BFN01_04110 [Microbacterium sp. AR7-10]
MSLFDSSSKGVKFTNVGDSITGTVVGATTERQQTKFGTQEPDFWPNGDPKMQILVNLQTTLREDGNDDGERTLYVASKNMKKAIGDAIRASGASDVAAGGQLTVTFIGNDPNSKNPANPAKLYQAQYTPGASAFAQPTAATPAPAAAQAAAPAAAPAPQAVPQPVQAAPAPAAAPAAQQPGSWLTPEQIGQLAQLRAAGIPEASIAAALGTTAEQIAAHDAHADTPF